MPDVILNIVCDDERWQKTMPDVEVLAQKVKDVTFTYMLASEKTILDKLHKHTFVYVCLADDAVVQELNRNFRGLDKPTNVLSFANLDSADFVAADTPFTEIDLGNIILAYETVCQEAMEQKITFEAHFSHLLVHGFLHILGYDHMTEQEAEQMESLEIKILNQLNIANPYEEIDE